MAGQSEDDSAFAYFSKTLLKSFSVLVIMFMLLGAKQRFVNKDTTLFLMVLFIIIGTVLLTILGIIDSYVYSNVLLGTGISLGMQLFNTTGVTI